MPSNTDLSERPSGGDDPAEEQTDDQPSEHTDDQAADNTDDQPADKTDDEPADKTDDEPANKTDDEAEEKTDDQPADESGESDKSDEPASESADEKADGESGGEGSQEGSGEGGGLNAKRQNMLDLVNKWMPTSLSNPRVDGSPAKPGQDLMAKAGWDKARGQQSVTDRNAGKAVTTSCGDILAALLKLWKSNFVGYFGIRDQAKGGPGAKARGFYVDRSQLEMDGDVIKSPKPGDIIVLRDGIGKAATGVGHVGILVEAGKDVWKTADGGGGQLPDQTAQVNERSVRWVDGVPIMKSVTDAKEKEFDGWIDLDKLEQTGK